MHTSIRPCEAAQFESWPPGPPATSRNPEPLGPGDCAALWGETRAPGARLGRSLAAPRRQPGRKSRHTTCTPSSSPLPRSCTASPPAEASCVHPRRHRYSRYCRLHEFWRWTIIIITDFQRRALGRGAGGKRLSGDTHHCTHARTRATHACARALYLVSSE